MSAVTVPSPQPLADGTREALIELYRQILVADPDGYCKQHAQARMKELIGERSAEVVERMEREREISVSGRPRR